jgi:hypothetical protein
VINEISLHNTRLNRVSNRIIESCRYGNIIIERISSCGVSLTSRCLSHDVRSSCTGVCHGDELIYLFPFGNFFHGTKLTEEDEEIVDIMTTLWTNFAHSG